MRASRLLSVCLTALVGTSFLANPAPAQDQSGGNGGPPRGPDFSREKMWPAPTAEDWKKPVLITFQRTWDDAVAVSQETGKPILVCINMDGEIASEHYAGVRYRQPEIAALYQPYVTVIASVYRHNPRDYDDAGHRILCPRFGSVTCGEHIAIEPIIYEKFCDGKRIAPRHIAVDLNGKETYDVYYRNDTASVFADIREKVPEGRPSTVVRGDRPILERVASRDITDRTAVEKAYQDGDAELRRSLLEAARQHADIGQLDLLRLAVFGLDVDLSRDARTALTKTEAPEAAALVSEALAVPMEPAERDALIATLKRLGSSSPLARWLAGVHQGLAVTSTAVDVKGWNEARAGGEYPAPTLGFSGASQIETRTEAVEERPNDPIARLELAEASLALALEAPNTYTTNPRMAAFVARHLYEDARKLGHEAENLGAKGWRVDAVLSLAAYYAGDTQEAYARAPAAVAKLPPGDTSWSSMAVVTVFAEARWKAIKAAVKEGKDWPSEWLSDVHAAYSLLLNHPLGTDSQVMWHYDMLDWLGARNKATRVLEQGLQRFKDSDALHGQLCKHLLKEAGPAALEEAYGKMLESSDEPARLAMFAARASVAAADQYRRTRGFDEARAAYARAVELYDRVLKAYPEAKSDVDTAVCLALGGRARVSYQLGDDEAALADVLMSLQRAPESAGDRDGLGITPVETAQMLLTRVREANQEERVAKLESALGALDPELLRPPEER